MVEKHKHTSLLVTLFSILLFVIPVGVLSLVLLKDSIQVDFPSQCYIRIQKEQLAGDKKEVAQALQELKAESPEDYVALCKNVNSVVLGKCVVAQKTSPRVDNLKSVGCYVKGSRSIYLNTSAGAPDYGVPEIKEALVKYTADCQSFWEGIDR